MDGAFEIDGIELWPQPDDHAWAPGQQQVIGRDGNGLPIFAKYRDLTLTVKRDLNGQYNWDDFVDGASHSLVAPAPDSTDKWTTYTDVNCVVSHGLVDDAEAMQGISMLIKKAVA